MNGVIMMIYYFIKFRLANDKMVGKVQLDSATNQMIFEKAKQDFNRAGAKARTYKQIVKQTINSSSIDIILEVKKHIPSPTMCFRNYSKFIIDNYENIVKEWITTSGNFLRGIEVYEIDSPKLHCGNNVIEEKEMSNKDLIKAIVDLCMEVENKTTEDKKQRQWTITKIKDIVKEYYQ